MEPQAARRSRSRTGTLTAIVAGPPPDHTLLLPERSRQARTTQLGTLPDDVIRQSASRLSVLALIYASVVFVAGFWPLLFHEPRAHLGSNPIHWVPGAIAIGLALAVAILIPSRRMPLRAVAAAGPLFEVVGSYGIVAVEFINPIRLTASGFVGFSWVAIWTLLFTIVVPTRPRRAAAAALASVSSVPIGMAVLTAAGVPTLMTKAGPVEFFFSHVFAYLFVVAMAYVEARVVYGLGTEVRRAGSWEAIDSSSVWGRGDG